jgi:hypothetical protein
MKLHHRDIVDLVRKDRLNGFSLRQLERKYKVSSSRISVWVKDIEVNNKAYLEARERQLKSKKLYEDLSKKFTITHESAKFLASLLYWCEGSKYPSTNRISFTNSDPALVKTFIALLRKGFDIKENKFRVILQVHATQNYEVVLDYWSNLLSIPKDQFYTPTITRPMMRRKRMNYMGTGTVKYYDVKLLLNLMGIYESFGRIQVGEVAERPKA